MLNLDALEQEVLTRWNESHTFERSVAQRQGAKPFVLWEGPPTANGMPGLHHVLTRTFKDIVGRYQTMSGRLVERKGGWDEHGLPVEIEVQKAMGLKTKQDIEKLGVENFNKACALSTQKYIGEWEALTHRMGYWIDLKKAYRTSNAEYIRRVWKILDQMMEKGLIYQAHKIVPWACDSGTTVSNAEVAQGYKEVTDTSAYVLFHAGGNHYLCAWTTTPWTLPANMGLAVNPDLEYKVCRMHGKRIISLMAVGEVERTIKGSEMVGWNYEHPFTSKPLRVYCADFVKAEKTGVVHIAPAFGEDDYNLFKSKNVEGPIVCHVDPDGSFNTQAPDFLFGRKLIGKTFEGANNLILKDLEEKGLLLQKEPYTHQYPHNWRTGLPLIYFLRPSWYVAVNKIREEMIAANETVNWFPANVKNGRFGEWLKGDVDWSISRERYWGTPLPFYSEGNKSFFHMPPAPHKPLADGYMEHGLYGQERREIKRTPEVLDCWFDSGAMPFAAFDEFVPADFICEAVDQTRGWFYSLLAIGVAMTGKSPYKNVMCLGHLLDKDSHKMSKSKGNSVDPWEMMKTFGADGVRWYMARNPVGNSLAFNKTDIRNVVSGFINRLWNCWTFYETYQAIDKVEPSNEITNPLDMWIVARAKMLVQSSKKDYDNYDISNVTEAVEQFVDDLSNIWIRSNRSRFWNTSGEGVDRSAYGTLSYCLKTVCQVAAPILPFLSDYIWNKLCSGSVHLSDFPTPEEIIEKEVQLCEQMTLAQNVINLGRNARDAKKIKIRQPLRSLYCPAEMCPTDEVFVDLIKEELNVKFVVAQTFYPEGTEKNVTFDFEVNDELLGEGLSRDFVRCVQELRKKSGLVVTDHISLTVDFDGNDKLRLLLQPFISIMMKKLLAKEWSECKVVGTAKIDNYNIGLAIEKFTLNPIVSLQQWGKLVNCKGFPCRGSE